MASNYSYAANRIPAKDDVLGVTTPDQWKQAAVLFDKIWVPANIRVPGKGLALQTQYGDIPPELTFGAYELDDFVTSRFAKVIYQRGKGVFEITGEEDERQDLYDAFLQPVAKVYSDLGFRITPLYPSESLFERLFTDGTEVAYQAALQNLPLLDQENVNWEEIVSFREDVQAVRKVRQLRLWLIDAIKSDNIHDATDKIAQRIEQYTDAVHKHGLKTILGASGQLAAGTGLAALLGVIDKPLPEAISTGLLLTGGTLAWVTTRLIAKDTILRGPNSEIAILHDAQRVFAKQRTISRVASKEGKRKRAYRSAKHEEHPPLVWLERTINIALELSGGDRYLEGETIATRALELLGGFLPVEHPCVVACHRVLAMAQYKKGNYKKAEQLFRDLVDIYQQQFGQMTPETLSLRHFHGLVLGEIGRFSEAEREDRETLALKIAVLGKEDIDVFATQCNLARDLYGLGRFDEAETECRKALSTFQNILGEGHPDVLKCRNILACALDAERKLVDAEAEHRAVLSLLEKAGIDDDVFIYQTCYNLALPLIRQGKLDEALAFAQRSLEGRLRLFGSDHVNVVEAAHLVRSLREAVQDGS